MPAAGAQRSLFGPDAVTLLFQHRPRIPRLVQNLALNAMLWGAHGDAMANVKANSLPPSPLFPHHNDLLF
ncbi:MAG: hypothetical protein HUU21_04905 [Polyangiaceae bacterium]|nr:hypothetical protein [Polyangiaceae bacterium]